MGIITTQEEFRRSTGQMVRDIAAQYYAGLVRISGDIAVKQFNERLALSDPLALSAIRLAEMEVFAGA